MRHFVFLYITDIIENYDEIAKCPLYLYDQKMSTKLMKCKEWWDKGQYFMLLGI